MGPAPRASSRSTAIDTEVVISSPATTRADGERVTPIDVGRALGLLRCSMVALADRLEARGLIRRARHPHDRRLLLLKATPQGRRLPERALGALLAQLAELADALAPRAALRARRRRGPAAKSCDSRPRLFARAAPGTPVTGG